MSGFWGSVALIGFVGWLVSTIGFILTAFPERNRFQARMALLWGIPLVVLYLVWVSGMLNV